MEAIFASLILACSTNIDNLAIAIVYRLKQIKINIAANLLIAIFSALSTFASMSLGDWLNQFFPANLAQGFGSSILILIGFWTIGGIVQQKLNYLKNKTEQEQLDSICKNSSINLEYESKRIITLQEAGLLGTALTITNLGTGISAGIAQLNILLTSGCSFLSSLLAISLGAFLGKTISSLFSRNKLEFIAGLSLTCLGIYEYFSP